MPRHREALDDARGGALLGAGLGGIIGLIIGALMLADAWSVSDAVTERVTVTAIEPAGERIVCRSRSFTPDTHGQLVSYRSQSPPAGLPAEFDAVECPRLGLAVGDSRSLRRTGPTRDDLHFDPIESWGHAYGMAGTVLLVLTAACALGGAAREVFRGWRYRRRRSVE